jgi:sterol desaturase/sphingolipid hydroxylase (fatty acid hydroxylase superfamily)
LDEIFLQNESEIYSVAFFATITIVALWEGAKPRRETTQPLKLRWKGNLSIAFINLLFIRVIFPVTTVGFSLLVEQNELGLLPKLGMPGWIAIFLGIFVIDLGRWIHHFLLHQVPVLWRFHRIHHADHDYDFTIGLRFHPFEGIFTTGFTFIVIALFGIQPFAVLISEVFVAVSGIIVHANGKTYKWIEDYVRIIFVTPDMHRIHHSIYRFEHDSNYAAVFSIWDRLFRTYVPTPSEGQIGMVIGLPGLRDKRCLKLKWMLLSPFKTIKATKSDI